MEELDLLGTGERPITMQEAAELLPKRVTIKPNGQRETKKFPVKNIIRWIRTGFRGVFLEGAKLGNVFVTSAEAIKRFTDKCREEDKRRMFVPQSAVDAVNKQPEPAKKSRARRELEKLGYMKPAKAKAS